MLTRQDSVCLLVIWLNFLINIYVHICICVLFHQQTSRFSSEKKNIIKKKKILSSQLHPNQPLPHISYHNLKFQKIESYSRRIFEQFVKSEIDSHHLRLKRLKFFLWDNQFLFLVYEIISIINYQVKFFNKMVFSKRINLFPILFSFFKYKSTIIWRIWRIVTQMLNSENINQDL